MAGLLEAAISRKARVHYVLADELPAIEADATQMRQVIMNLITNASDAIEEKHSPKAEENRIDITTGITQCQPDYFRDARTGEDLSPGRYVFMEVTDTGAGMERETQQHIFDPFFTTRFTGRGLGLSAVLGIVRGHHGALKVQSEPGKGSTFRLLFPATSRPAKPLHRRPHVKQAWRSSGTLLLVDDERIVRTVGKRMLERVGFVVLLAADGREAVEVFRAHAGEICCVVLDLTMPNMDGEQTFRELRSTRPDIPIIMSSGYNQQEVTNRLADATLAGFLQKPYEVTALLAAVREVIEPNG
jgi:CheY-like chemotaxis protein